MNFQGLQTEVKRRATLNEGGTSFNTAVNNAINFSLSRTARESNWRSLRRKSTFTTNTSYTEGTGAVSVTEDSTAVTVTGATFITDAIQIGRRIKIGGSSKNYKIASITGETTLVLDQAYDSDDSTTQSYTILPQDEYNLPIQTNQKCVLWHEEYGVAMQLIYLTEQDFLEHALNRTTTSVPSHYRMWGDSWTIEQPRQASAISIVSSSASDTDVNVTVFGTVSGYPDYEVINTDGTTSVSGSKSFSSVERVVSDASCVGRITVSANSGEDTVAVIPVGNTTDGIKYSKVQIYPLPSNSFIMNVLYYKTPYKLVNSTDVHELGEEFDEAIILLATGKLKSEQNQKEADRFFALYRDEILNLRRTNVDKIDWFKPLKSRNRNTRGHRVVSNLLYQQAGAYYGPRS